MPRQPRKPIVVDANIILAALLKDSTTREIILDRGLDLRTPPWLWEEVAGRYRYLQQRTGLPAAALDELLRLLRSRITDIPAGLVEARKAEALRRTRRSGAKDAPYVAAVLAVDGVLWTHDAKLAAEGLVPTVKTADLLQTERK